MKKEKRIKLEEIKFGNNVYHLMILENLLKDYKWNNPKLKGIENNELITDLKLLS